MEDISMEMYKTISKELRETTENLSNKYVYDSMALARKLESKRILGGRRDSNKTATVPSPWAFLGKGRGKGTITLAGDYLELWLPYQNYNVGEGVEGQKLPVNRSPESEECIARRVNARARKQIRRIVNANRFQAMHTLTLALPSNANNRLYATTEYALQCDYTYVRKLMKCFIQRLNRKLAIDSIPYLVVFELHDSLKTRECKRSTWHIHLVTSTCPDIKRAVSACWSHGLTNYQDYRYNTRGELRDSQVANPGAYVSEYIGKEGAQFGDGNLRNKKRYSTSRSTLRPRKVELSLSGVKGDLEKIQFEGEEYRCTYYHANTIPGSVLASHTAHYVREEKEK